ncbi:MAG TPA: tetratricopeptide repeat protein, partial [Gemmatimonadaceae bacterium]|nr:tetratricopeptide repeat protein [Gemmatimonadaceae bacterium]
WKAVAPAGLSPMYAMPAVVDATSARFLAAYATIALVSITVFAFRRRWPALAVAWVAFVAVEAPMLGVHQNGLQIAADRYTYFAGPIVAMVAALALLTLASRIAPRAAAGVGTAVVAALAAATWRQTGVWHDTRSLWTRAIAVDERSAFAQNSLAGLLLEDDSVPAAIDHFTRALAAEPDYPQAHNGLGIALGRLGRTDEAIAHFQRALAVDPGYDEPAGNWGVLLARSGDVPGAIVRFEQALAINPHDADIRVNLGNAYVRIGRFDDAIAQYREAVHIRPDDADAHYNWGVALAQQSKLDDAVAEFEAALRARPDHADAREALGRAQRLLRAAGPPDDYAADALSVTTRTSLSAT